MDSTRLAVCLLIGTLLPCTTALGQSLLYEYYGTANERLGAALGAAGDVNLDGYDDFIISSILGADGFGRAEVRSGLDGSLLYSYTGQGKDDLFGGNVAAIGDVDGDGHPDFAISSIRDTTNGNDSGAVYLYSGKDGSLLRAFFGEVGWEFGNGLAGAGDVNADGFADLIAGSSTGPELTGLARVYSGATGELLHEFSGDNHQDWFGSAVDGAGDVNADGYDDLIIGAWGADPGGDRSGQVRLYSGFDGSILLELDGTVEVGLFGLAVASVGDVTGDGCPDFAVGSPEEDGFYNRVGVVRVFDGSSGALFYSVQGRTPLERMGAALDGGSDVNGDGVPDWVVGCPAQANIGMSLGRVFDGPSGVQIYEVRGESVGDAYGATVGLLGDLNQSSTCEVGFGGYRFGEGGVARVFTLDCTAEVRYCPTNPNSTGQSTTIGTLGSHSIFSNDFTLTATGGVPGNFSIFLYAGDAVQVPLGDGFLCLSPGWPGIRRLHPAQMFDKAGEVSRWLDFTSPPANEGKGEIITGSTWNFQLWYRDPGGPGGSGFNLSDAISVTFCP